MKMTKQVTSEKMATLAVTSAKGVLFILLLHLVSIKCQENDSLGELCNPCRGYNTSCSVVSGIFTLSKLDVGYNHVAQIPRGACFLNITEIRKSSNHLALRMQDSAFLLNGNWRLSHSGSYPGAGTVFHYQRQDLSSLETIRSPGPLYESVDLLIMHQQQTNPGIKYEYKLPPSFVKSVPKVAVPVYTLPPPRLQRQVDLVPQASQVVSRSNNIPLQQDSFPSETSENNNKNHRHLHLSKPVFSSQNHKKIYYWKITGYTNCSEPCDEGIQRSIIECVHSTEQGGTKVVYERLCSGEEKPLEQRLKCNLKPCLAGWIVGNWSECTGECDEGMMTRRVYCEQRIGPTIRFPSNEGACYMKPKPETERKCELPKRCNFWLTKEWSPCSESCGNGVRRRKVYCNNSENIGCDINLMPIEVKSCNMGPCKMFQEEGTKSIWMVSEWGKSCSNKCGRGVETRHVVCTGGHGSPRNYYGYGFENDKARNETEVSAILIQDENKVDAWRNGKSFQERGSCNDGEKPDSERECFSEVGCEEPHWFAGDWGECSSKCGAGFKTRQVVCVNFSRGKFKIVSDHLCTAEPKPETKEACRNAVTCPPTWFSTEWGDTECSALCGGGIQKRYVSCRDPNFRLPSTLCSDDDRPVERRSCNEQQCALSPTPYTSIPQNKSSDFQKKLQTSSLTSTESSQENKLPSLASSTSVAYVNATVTDPKCPDEELEYRNCPFIVQAGLCKYIFYRTLCCNNCYANDIAKL